MSDHLHVALALDGCGWHPAAWRDPAAAPPGPFAPSHWTALAAEAERGLADFLTLEDALVLQPGTDGNGPVRGRPDMALVAARLLAATSRIGIVPTVTTLYTEPARIASALGTLDRLGRGRTGWRVQAGRRAEAPGFGAEPARALRPGELDGTAGLGPLLEQAAGAAREVRRLWRERPPVSPQGQPPVIALAHAPLPYRFAARGADLVMVTPHDREQARSIVGQVRAAEAAEGRTGAPLRVYGDLVVFLDAARKARLDALLGAPCPSDAAVFTGTPGELADLMLDWRDAGLDGFRLRPGALPDDLTAITGHVLPELRRRGAFRTAYGAATLRGRLGLARPAGRAAA
ncbi:LLM class flavin-dependent oxidoreductase [Actinomadura xylanilytica]|uniref:LLM class flavin-dependent oxidoreductase n=1 Tax=Actinomadura xylanilytica TaxID=887459 RepID=UPI00255AA1E3|nr:LLM class flavin-dependent oxidoreductase [Actinomadura xylanilytica]MDL4771548.1 LLM class flavin-dependent oxidoreductase [Actinomadura xylanilytica]